MLQEVFDQFVRQDLRPLPLAESIRGMDGAAWRRDLLVGLRVAAMVIPGAVTYAAIAGLPVGHGLVGAVVAVVAGALFGGSRFMLVLPTRVTSIMVFSLFIGLGAAESENLGVLTLMTGLFLLSGAALRLGDLARFVSRSVVVGFTAGAALLVVVQQVHLACGFSIDQARSLIEICDRTVRSLDQIDPAAVAVSCVTAAVWVLCVTVCRRVPASLAALAAGTVAGIWLGRNGAEFVLLEPAGWGDFAWQPPATDLATATRMAGMAVALSVLIGLEAAWTNRGLAVRSGERHQPNQDLLGLGLANVVSAFFTGLPAGTSKLGAEELFLRRATPVAALAAAAVTALAAGLLGFAAGWIPVPAVSAVILCTGFQLIDWQHLRISLSATLPDAVILAASAFAAILLPLDLALFLGMGTSFVLFLRRTQPPRLAEFDAESTAGSVAASKDPEVLVIHVEGEVWFGASDIFRQGIEIAGRHPGTKVVILRVRDARYFDATSSLSLIELVNHLHAGGRHLVIAGVGRDIRDVLRHSGVIDAIGRANLFVTAPAAGDRAMRDAMRRAEELIGREPGEVRIFHDPERDGPRAS